MSNIMPTYGRINLSFERGEGPWLYTKEGKKYLDFASGIAVNTFGHSNSRLIKVLSDQSKKLWHTSNLYEIQPQIELAELLCQNSFGESVFFCNSGAEALEGTIKLCRRYHYHNKRESKIDILVCKNAFHGRTLGTLAAGDNVAHREGFGVNTSGFIRVSFGDISDIENVISNKTAAILLEPIQGEGGINIPSTGFYKQLKDLCTNNEILLAFDEVQTGIGRTGKLFAHQWEGVSPDVIAIAKGLGGGFPIGAVIATEKSAAGMKPGTHGSTFGGNFLAASVAKEVVSMVLEPYFMDNVILLGNSLQSKIELLSKKYPDLIKGIRGKGLMLGIICNIKNSELCEGLRQEGLLTVAAADNILRLLPPLNIEKEHVDVCIDIIDKVLDKLDNNK